LIWAPILPGSDSRRRLSRAERRGQQPRVRRPHRAIAFGLTVEGHDIGDQVVPPVAEVLLLCREVHDAQGRVTERALDGYLHCLRAAGARERPDHAVTAAALRRDLTTVKREQARVVGVLSERA